MDAIGRTRGHMFDQVGSCVPHEHGGQTDARGQTDACGQTDTRGQTDTGGQKDARGQTDTGGQTDAHAARLTAFSESSNHRMASRPGPIDGLLFRY
jgi:hypothetical protein